MEKVKGAFFSFLMKGQGTVVDFWEFIFKKHSQGIFPGIFPKFISSQEFMGIYNLRHK